MQGYAREEEQRVVDVDEHVVKHVDEHAERAVSCVTCISVNSTHSDRLVLPWPPAAISGPLGSGTLGSGPSAQLSPIVSFCSGLLAMGLWLSFLC